MNDRIDLILFLVMFSFYASGRLLCVIVEAPGYLKLYNKENRTKIQGLRNCLNVYLRKYVR